MFLEKSILRRHWNRGKGACAQEILSEEDGGWGHQLEPLGVQRRPRTLYTPRNIRDRFCLARSIAIGLEWHRLQGRHRTQAFQRFVNDNGEMQTAAAVELLMDSGCRLRKRYYGFSDADKIQRHLDAVCGREEFRIVVLDAKRMFRVCHRTRNKPAQKDICLVLWQRHYSFVGHPREIFNVDICINKNINFKSI